MQNKLRQYASAALLAIALAGGVPLAAQAQATSDGWQFEASIYGWFPAIGGSTNFPALGGGPSISVSSADVIDALKFAFMGSFEARQGQWGIWTDLVYADFGATKNATRKVKIDGVPIPISVNANLQLDVKSWIWTLAGLYKLKADTEGSMDALFGFRMLDLTNGLGWRFSGPAGNAPLTGSAEVSETNWDAVVGLKGRAMLGEERTWFIPFYVDVGTGQSKLTWQINAGVGYQFGWGSLIASWRYLDYDFKSSSKVTDMSFNGPVIGAVFKF